ncbi:MoaF N-terminal domain-containing protein [Microbacterium sp. SORGH_AS_0862]|uniref:MoaF N-terminal domain-containing protein n=1 Tax=Microbacterium sp. SORGH_AS_0862 TaxID=3041789 RepID=UPI002792B093|nr:MoaF N-terminal domain-containing protein [Microbacterium sp. SORGH_AS_0862]MDQ1205355.1 hypothetical protein [Microbacterium sp. SORGH_AS_0862]
MALDRARHGRRHGIAQYRYPLSYVLAGMTLDLRSPEGDSIRCHFTGVDRVTLTRGAHSEVSVYECLPVAEDIYLVSFEIAALFAIVDLARGRALVVDVAADTEIAFTIEGAIDGDGAPIAATDEMTGTSVSWVLGDGRELRFEYLSESESRQSWSPRHDRVHTLPTRYYTFADGVYVVVAKTAAPPGIDLPQGLNRLVMVQDFRKVVVGGVALSAVFNERVLFSGYGAFRDAS